MSFFKPSLGWTFCQNAGSKCYIPAKIQGLPAWTCDLWNNRLTVMLYPAKAYVLLLWSSTTDHSPWLVISTAAESSETPLYHRKGWCPADLQACLGPSHHWSSRVYIYVSERHKSLFRRETTIFMEKVEQKTSQKKTDQPQHQVLVFSPKVSDSHFLSQCLLLAQSFLIYMKHC